MSSPTPVARISEWLRTVAIDRAERAVPVPGAVVLLHSGFPLAHDHNRALLWSDDAGAAADVGAAVDEAMGAAGLSHRRIDARTEAGSASWALDEPGFEADVSTISAVGSTPLEPAVEAVFLAVPGVGEGQPVSARADLYLRDGVGQIEDVWTLPAGRNQGLASALVRRAAELAGQRGADLVFLVAEGDDWPAGLYRRLGFSDLFRMASFAR